MDLVFLLLAPWDCLFDVFLFSFFFFLIFIREQLIYSVVLFFLSYFLFLATLGHAEVPEPGIEPALQQSQLAGSLTC